MPELLFSHRRDLGLVCVTGADARAFLQSQTTQAIDDQGPTEVRLAAWLNAKGRIRALFDVVPSADGFRLIAPRANADWLVEQLKLFVLRSDVGLKTASDLAIASVFGEIDAWLADQGISFESSSIVERNELVWIRTEASGAQVIGPLTTLESTLADFNERELDEIWAKEIASGRPIVSAAIRERHIPQMLNLDKLGAISFNKGCYPGQEIVARTENLGQVKRRMKRFQLPDGERPAAGDAIIDASSQTVGEINRVAAVESGYELLAVVQIEADSKDLKLEADGRELELLSLPYET